MPRVVRNNQHGGNAMETYALEVWKVPGVVTTRDQDLRWRARFTLPDGTAVGGWGPSRYQAIAMAASCLSHEVESREAVAA